MNCSSDVLQAYLDDELDMAQRLAIEDHIRECGHCSDIWGRMRAQKAEIRAAAQFYAAPPELRESVRRAALPARIATSKCGCTAMP